MSKKNLVGAAIHIASWVIGYWLAYFIMEESSNRGVYGFIVAWWMACYIGYIANIGVNAALLAFPVYTILLAISILTGYSWFYHDPPKQFDLFFIFLVLTNGLVFISPILVNASVRKVGKKFGFI